MNYSIKLQEDAGKEMDIRDEEYVAYERLAQVPVVNGIRPIRHSSLATEERIQIHATQVFSH